MNTIEVFSYDQKSANNIADPCVKELFEKVLNNILKEYRKYAEHTNDDPLNYSEVAQRSFFLNALIRGDVEHQYISLFEYHAGEKSGKMADLYIMDTGAKEKYSIIIESKHAFSNIKKDRNWTTKDFEKQCEKDFRQVDKYLKLAKGENSQFYSNVELLYKAVLYFDTTELCKLNNNSEFEDYVDSLTNTGEDFYRFFYSKTDGQLSHGLHVYGKIVEYDKNK